MSDHNEDSLPAAWFAPRHNPGKSRRSLVIDRLTGNLILR
jgi:hypothetical protein